MPKGILERLSEGVVLGDGGCLLELERRGYAQAGPFVPEVIQTLTFYASEDKRPGEDRQAQTSARTTGPATNGWSSSCVRNTRPRWADRGIGAVRRREPREVGSIRMTGVERFRA